MTSYDSHPPLLGLWLGFLPEICHPGARKGCLRMRRCEWTAEHPYTSTLGPRHTSGVSGSGGWGSVLGQQIPSWYRTDTHDWWWGRSTRMETKKEGPFIQTNKTRSNTTCNPMELLVIGFAWTKITRGRSRNHVHTQGGSEAFWDGTFCIGMGVLS